MHDNNLWRYQGEYFTKEIAQQKIDEGYLGFIYVITDITTGRRYIGKKLLVRKVKLAPLKGTKKKRSKIAHSDWEKYFGSSELVQSLVAERPDDFTREVIILCRTKGELNYVEAREQFAREVLLTDDYFNSFIGVKIHRSHVKSLQRTDNY